MRINLLIVIVGLVVRAAAVTPVLVADRQAGGSDSGRYLILAQNLRQHGVFAKAVEDGYAHQGIQRIREQNGTLPAPDAYGFRPEGFRTPGYPVFIAAIAAVGGDRRWVLVVQVLLGALLGVGVRTLALRTGLTPWAATLAAILWAVHPALIFQDGRYLTESLFNASIIGGLWAISGRTKAGCAAGVLLLGFAGLVRPLAFLYIPTAVVLGAIVWTTWRARFWWAVAAVSIALLPSGLWALRNAAVGEGARVSTVSDFNLLFYTVPYAMAEAHGADWNEEWRANVDQLLQELAAETKPGDDVFSRVRSLGVRETLARPMATLKVQIKALVKLTLDQSLADVYEERGWTYTPSGLFSALVLGERGETQIAPAQVALSLGWMALNALLAALAVGGAVVTWLERRYWFAAMWIPPVLLFAVATGSVSLERFRVPILLPLFLLGALAIEAVPRLVQRRSGNDRPVVTPTDEVAW